MRVRIIFRLQNRGGVVPFHHQHLLAQWIKGVIVKSGNTKYINYKTYNFSGLKGQTRVSRKGLHFYSSKITLVFSSQDENFVDFFIKQIMTQKQIEIGALKLEPEEVDIEKQINLDNPVNFVCLSPLIIVKPVFDDKSIKKFIHPKMDEFSDHIYNCTLLRMQKEANYNNEELEEFYKFQLVPDIAYIRKLDERQKKYARIYSVFSDDLKFEVRGYTFPFKLYASPEVLDFVFNNGIGYFTHKGFGMLDLAGSDPNSRIETYEKITKEAAH